ncbi:2-phosphoxylose phosphatase 1-like [Centruroides sculpturatus]|uniref:2-phosphoxylose phosphatase 1-like n=1 Tax=Centruroides sculpturatus TaxID=218467 RepID=UPI000C6D4E44|nr:2-phosphoxylose phosphatase 1-like [Centruroides sculpturatus]
MTDNPSVIMKLISRHKILFGSLLVVWIVGMICTVTLMGRNGHTKIRLRRTSHTMLLHHRHNDLPPPNSYKMVKALKYCNPPEDISLGHEGKMPGNYSLELVVVLIRHGDRAPLRQIRNQSYINCGVSKELNHSLLNKYISYVKSVQRLPKEDPFSAFNLFPHPKLCNPSQLTLLGATQHLWLGNILSQVYNTYWKLLTKDFTYNNIKVYSTVYARTFQSAVAFLFGFLPKFDFSEIKIIPSFDTRFCLKELFCKCPVLDFQRRIIEKKQRKLINSHPAVLHLLQQLNPIVKSNLNQQDITSATAMFDSLMGYICHNSQLPCIPNTHICVTIDHVRNLMAFLDWERKQLAGDGIHKRNSLLKMHGFLYNVHQNMQNLINEKPNAARFILYSGHDITLSPVASCLGFNDGVIPSYASRIIFELYSSTISNLKSYNLRILYNGKDVTKHLPFCKSHFKAKKSKSKQDHLCSFDRFTKFIHSDFFKVMNTSSYEVACDFPLTTTQYSNEKSTSSGV